VSNRKNNLSGFLSQVSRVKVDGQSTNTLLSSTNIVNQAQPKSSRSTKPPSLGDAKTSSFSAKVASTGINFGSPSNNRQGTQQSSSLLGNLLKQTASGGIASVFSGGFASITGIGGLISGIASLFGGGKSTPPPLVEFQLPNPQSQTVYVSSNGSTALQGNAVESSGTGTTGTGIYPKPGSPGISAAGASSQSFQYQSTQIAQAVKTALLNSSSLNDVIAEI
jgi:hypothetical protein